MENRVLAIRHVLNDYLTGVERAFSVRDLSFWFDVFRLVHGYDVTMRLLSADVSETSVREESA